MVMSPPMTGKGVDPLGPWPTYNKSTWCSQGLMVGQNQGFTRKGEDEWRWKMLDRQAGDLWLAPTHWIWPAPEMANPSPCRTMCPRDGVTTCTLAFMSILEGSQPYFLKDLFRWTRASL